MGVQINGKETIVAPLDKYIAEHEHILTPEGDQQVRTLVEQLISTHHLENILHYDKVAAAALRQTDRDTYQAMEALVHNLCTLSCFPGYEKVTVFDHCLNQWITYEFEEFYHHFVKGRYSALSLNPSEGKFELKPITEIFKTYSDRKLIRITDELDHELICTEDHEFIAIDRDGNYVEATADELVSVAEAGTHFHFTMHATTISSVPIKCIEDLGKYDGAVYDLSVEDNHTFILSNGMIVKNCRSGAQVPFSSLNFGTDTSKEGRMVSKNLLLATDAGLGAGETAIFPISIFRLKKGINFDEGDPNYDLFKLACKVSARRSFPNFLSVDAPFNLQYYKPGHPETEVGAMGCRTRVISNVFDPEHQQITGRGNLFFTTMNLPYLALLAKEQSPANASQDDVYRRFMQLVDQTLEEVIDLSHDRFEAVAKRHVYNYPFLFGQYEYLGSEKLQPTDEIREVIKQGTQTVGFIGLAETLTALFGKHHGESAYAQQKGLEIIGHMNDWLTALAYKTKTNYSLMMTPAEGCSGRLLRATRKRFGIVPGVTDKEYFTNSAHVRVDYEISAFDKVDIEAPYHALTPAGLTYIGPR